MAKPSQPPGSPGESSGQAANAAPPAERDARPGADPTLSTPPPGLPGTGAAIGAARDPARYRFVREHGRGGIGRVMEAHDGELGRVVAVKELLAPDSGDAEARFFREVRLTARLQHPAIVPVHDAGRWQDTGKAFYSMKLVSGRSLQALAAEARSLEGRIALLPNLLAVAEAVAYAHAQHVVHRDLKPANVIVGQYGETIVIDWGLAKELLERPSNPGTAELPDEAALHTLAGAVMGTPAFMAPEQARGEEVDERADVYALGAMLYFVLTGALPHGGDSVKEVLRSLLLGAPMPLREREPGIPADLAAIVDKAMARERAGRYREAGELAADLRRFQTGQLVGAHDYSGVQLLMRWVRRNRAAAAAGAATLVALAVLGLRETSLRQAAEAATLSMLEQRGRDDLELGRPARAAVSLAEAYRRKPESLALRALVTEAVQPLQSRKTGLRGHTKDVVAAAWSADGTRVVTGSADRTVRVWDAASGRQELLLEKHESWVEDVAFSPDGAWVGSAGGDLILWDARSGEKKHVFPGGGFRVGFSPDSRFFVRGGMRGAMSVVDVASGKLLVDRPGYYRDRLSAITFHPSGETVVTASWDGRVTFWDTASWKEIRTLEDHRDRVSTADFSDDGRLLLSADHSGRVHIRDGATGEVLQAFQISEGADSVNAWFGEGGRTVVTSSHDGSIRVWHATSGQLLRSMDTIHRGKMFDGALSPDESAMAVTGIWGADLWRFEAVEPFRIFAGGRFGIAMVHPGAITPDGSRFVAGVETGTGTEIHVWDAASGELVKTWPARGQAHALAIALSGERVVTAGTDKLPARLFDREGALVATLDGHEGRIIHDVEASADGATVATIGYDGRVVFWRAEDGARTGRELSVDGRATAAAFSPDGTRVAVTNENGVLTVFRVGGAANELAMQVAAHPTWIQDVAFSPDGTRIVTTGRQDHTVRLWDARTGAMLRELAGHSHNGWRASFSPDGRLVASVSTDRTARLWDAGTGELLRIIHGPDSSAVFDATGRRLFTTGERAYVVGWDVVFDERSPEEIARFVERASPWRLNEGRLELPSR